MHRAQAGRRLDRAAEPGDEKDSVRRARRRAAGAMPFSERTNAVLAVVAWMSANSTLALTNKYMMALSPMRLPILLTCLHMATSWALGTTVVSVGLLPAQTIQTTRQLRGILVLSSSVGASVALGVACLRYIPVSLDQAVGSVTPAATAVLVYVFLRRVETKQVYATLGAAIAGVLLASQGDPSFQAFGFLLSVLSTLMRALKSVMQQKLMSTDKQKLDAINLMRFQALAACGILLPFGMYFEGVGELYGVLHRQYAAGNGLWLLFFGCNVVLAFLTNLTQFWMTKATSAITSQLMGSAKSVLLSAVSIVVFRNPVTPLTAIGYVVTFGSIAAYTRLKQLPEHASRDVGQGLPVVQPEEATKLLHDASDGSLTQNHSQKLSSV
ncbi:unnamed protein product [Pedinophyceae sp. YPF-701]|nr:unnamed protein product [Pedinophyceae sp. YPF-701]